MTYEIKRFPFDGTVDADGHILEPPDLWENYLEAKYPELLERFRDIVLHSDERKRKKSA